MSTLTAGNVTVSCSLSADTSGNLVFQSGGNVTAMTIDASGKVSTNGASNTYGGTGSLSLNGSSGSAVDLELRVGNTLHGYFYSAGTDIQIGSATNIPVRFLINDTEAARIDSSGNLLVRNTTFNSNLVGVICGATGRLYATADSATPINIDRLTNDGVLVDFRQANTSEGTISVSGTTVSYNGGHLARWSQLLDNSKDESILKGTVLSNLDEMCVWEKDGVVAENEQLNKMKVSDIEGDTNVAGVFVNWTKDEDYNSDDMNIAMTGDMIIRIAQGVTVQRGDLLMSAGDGTAKPQGDDIIRSKTIAKVTSIHVTCTYEDGSYCVPCVLMAC
jgi:hypothetical protein